MASLFKTNTLALRQELDTFKLYLENERTPLELVWRDIRMNIEPTLGKGLVEKRTSDSASKRDDEKIYNSEPRLQVQRLSAGLQSGITNPSRQWFRLGCGDNKIGHSRQVSEWLDYATECLHAQLQESNIYTSLNLMYMHLGVFGTSCGLLTEHEGVPFLHVFDEGAYWIEEDIHGKVSSCMLAYDLSARQLVDEFGEEYVPESLRKDGTETRVWSMVFARNRFGVDIDARDVHPDMPYVAVYFVADASLDAGGVLAIRGYRHNPIIAPRWQKGVNAYGVGCGFIALADCKQLQALEKDRMRAVKLNVDPPVIAPSSMRGQPIRTNPGGVTYSDDMSSSPKAPIAPLFVSGINLAQLDQTIQLLENRIRRLFYSDLFAMLMNISAGNKQMTATEVSELASERVSLLGPVLTRLNVDLLDPLVQGVWAITTGSEEALSRYEKLASPPTAMGEAGINIEYVSSLHIEQKSVSRVNAVNNLFGLLGPIAQVQPEALDKIDTDRAVDVIGDSLFEHGIVRDDEEVQQIRAQRAQAQQAQMEAQQAMSAGKALKDTVSAVKDIESGQPDRGGIYDDI